MRWQEVRAGGLGKPADGADDILVTPFTFNEGWAVAVFVRLRDRVDDGKARVVGSRIGGDVPCVDVVVFG